MNGLVLPPELVELILQHLKDDRTLQSCSLISRIWVIPCQRALFRCISTLGNHHRAVRLLRHLRRYPHLQILIRQMTIWDKCDSEAGNKHLSHLAALFPLMPRLTYLHIVFDRSRPWDARDQRFIKAFGAFLQASESLTDLVISNLQDEADLQQMFLYLEGTNVERVSLYTIRRQPGGPLRVKFFSSTLSVVPLPAIELLRVGLSDALQLHAALSFWLRQYPTMFPNLKHLEVVINSEPLDLGIWFRDIIKPAALQLESLRLELNHFLLVEKEKLPTNESLFEDLHIKHFKLCTFPHYCKPPKEAPLTNWFSSMLRQLANSGTTVHFVELTFTFVDLDDVEALSAQWETMDEVLSYSAFSGVQSIHFEDYSDTRTLITDRAQPELASVIRQTLPRLASRGVLCFQ